MNFTALFSTLPLAAYLVIGLVIAAAVYVAVAMWPTQAAPVRGRRLGRHMVRDISIQFHMLAGFPGDVNRSHPANIEPSLIDPTNPPSFYGQAVVGNPASQGVRAVLAGDTTIYGVSVRPYPTQQVTGGMAASIGAAPVAALAGVIDVLKNGYIMVQVSGGVQPGKFGAVYIWTGATGNGHVLGGFEAQATAGSTFQLAGAMWNGGWDQNQVAELILNF